MPVTDQIPAAVSPLDRPLLLSEVISALSFALDLTEGAVPGHALRSCILGMHIGARLNLSPELRSDLFFALLLKDIGCSSNAARISQIVGGDDRILKAAIRLETWTEPYAISRSKLQKLWGIVLPNAHPFNRLARIIKLARNTDKNNMEMVATRCERGAEIVRKLGFSEASAAAIHALDEHWDGRGYPDRQQTEDIPLLARILSISQHLDIFATARSPIIALDVLRERSGHWFDPGLVRTVFDLDHAGTLWMGAIASSNYDDTLNRVLDLAPPSQRPLGHQEIDRLCEAFADVVDAKSPFTYRHSLGVADIAVNIARTLGLSQSRCLLVRRAALLHDLGKLSLPNTILDKQGALSPEEREYVQKHPGITRQILARIRPFQEIAAVAGAHHERLDGSGYPDHLTAASLPLEARILAVADMYRALTETRPYRPGLTHLRVMELLRSDAPEKLDPDVVAALETWHTAKLHAKRPAKPRRHSHRTRINISDTTTH